MLIRLSDNKTLAECPDDIAAMILADPTSGDDMPDYSLTEINGLVHWALGFCAGENQTWGDTLQKARRVYSEMPGWNADNLDKALQMVQDYNAKVQEKDIGWVDLGELLGTGTRSAGVIDGCVQPEQRLALVNHQDN